MWNVRVQKKESEEVKYVKDKHGKVITKLYKRILVKVVIGEKHYHHQFVAPAGRGYSEADIQKVLEDVIEHLDKKFPGLEFKQIDILPNQVNFVAFKEREAPEIPAAEEST
jgi:hypothetical protein